MVVDAALFTLASNGVYAVEMSDLDIGKAPSCFVMVNIPEYGNRSFKFLDQVIRQGEVVGWNYEEVDGPNKGVLVIEGRQRRVPALRVLIIND